MKEGLVLLFGTAYNLQDFRPSCRIGVVGSKLLKLPLKRNGKKRFYYLEWSISNGVQVVLDSGPLDYLTFAILVIRYRRAGYIVIARTLATARQCNLLSICSCSVVPGQNALAGVLLDLHHLLDEAGPVAYQVPDAPGH